MAQPPKGGLVRGHDKPIHGSCAIYFPGGIIGMSCLFFLGGFMVVDVCTENIVQLYIYISYDHWDVLPVLSNWVIAPEYK